MQLGSSASDDVGAFEQLVNAFHTRSLLFFVQEFNMTRLPAAPLAVA